MDVADPIVLVLKGEAAHEMHGPHNDPPNSVTKVDLAIVMVTFVRVLIRLPSYLQTHQWKHLHISPFAGASAENSKPLKTKSFTPFAGHIVMQEILFPRGSHKNNP